MRLAGEAERGPLEAAAAAEELGRPAAAAEEMGRPKPADAGNCADPCTTPEAGIIIVGGVDEPARGTLAGADGMLPPTPLPIENGEDEEENGCMRPFAGLGMQQRVN